MKRAHLLEDKGGSWASRYYQDIAIDRVLEATVKRFYYETHHELRAHLIDFVTAYNFAKRLKTLKGLTHYE